MQHVDEGRLHAWLDGELPPAGPEGARSLERHLDECAACRARAAEERRIRDDASSILRRADPVEHPAPGVIPFPAPAPARRTARPWVALGWAASVLIALGIGWMARPEPDAPIAINTPSRPPAPAADATGAETAAQAAPAVQSAPVASTGVTRSLPANPAPREERVARPTVPPVAVMVPSADPAAPPPAPPVAYAEPLPTPPPPMPEPPPPPVAMTIPPPPPPPAPVEAAADLGAGTMTVRGRVTDARGQGVAGATVTVPTLAARTVTAADGSYTLSVPASSDTVQVVAARIGMARQSRSLVAQPESARTVDFALAPEAVGLEGVVVTREGAGRRASRTPAAALASPKSGGTTWTAVERAEAERALGRTLVTVPNLALLRIELGAVQGRAIVRVEQHLPDGNVISLVQRRVAGSGAPRPCETPVAGASCIAFNKTGILVEASAAVPPETLRVHLVPLF